jgi:sarcosine oxidase, subunit beta
VVLVSVQRTDVVIVGGGIIGLSTAYHLVLKQPSLRVVVVERETLTGTGATSKATGGIRHQFGTEVNVRLTQLSYPAFTRFHAEHDQPIGFRANGYLFLAASDQTWQALKANVALQQRLGVPVQLVSPPEARRLVPDLYVDDLLGGAF